MSLKQCGCWSSWFTFHIIITKGPNISQLVHWSTLCLLWICFCATSSNYEEHFNYINVVITKYLMVWILLLLMWSNLVSWIYVVLVVHDNGKTWLFYLLHQMNVYGKCKFNLFCCCTQKRRCELTVEISYNANSWWSKDIAKSLLVKNIADREE